MKKSSHPVVNPFSLGDSFAKSSLEPIQLSVLTGGGKVMGNRSASPAPFLGNNFTMNQSIGKSMLGHTTITSPTKKIDSMLKYGDGYAKQIEKQKKVIEGLHMRIGEIQSAIEQHRKEKAKIPKSNADNTSLPQKIRALEYRLSTQLQKFNQAVAENKAMRERIDALRKERVVFDVIYRQLELDIKIKREELIAMM